MCHGGQNRRNLATGLCILSCAWSCFGEKDFFWAEWKCNWCGGWGHKFRPQPEDQELFAKLEGIWNLPKPQVLGKIRRVTNWTKTKKGFYFLTVSCSIAFARLVSSALLLSESTRPPSQIVLGQRPATMCTLWMLYFHFKSQITPKKPSLNLPYFLSAQTKHCQHLKIFHPLKSLRQECRVCKNIHKISSTHRKLLQISWDFISLIKSIKTHPFCHSIAVCQCWKNNGFISQIIDISDESENWVIVKSRHLWLVCKLSALLLLPVTQPGNCWSHLHRAKVRL